MALQRPENHPLFRGPDALRLQALRIQPPNALHLPHDEIVQVAVLVGDRVGVDHANQLRTLRRRPQVERERQGEGLGTHLRKLAEDSRFADGNTLLEAEVRQRDLTDQTLVFVDRETTLRLTTGQSRQQLAGVRVELMIRVGERQEVGHVVHLAFQRVTNARNIENVPHRASLLSSDAECTSELLLLEYHGLGKSKTPSGAGGFTFKKCCLCCLDWKTEHAKECLCLFFCLCSGHKGDGKTKYVLQVLF